MQVPLAGIPPLPAIADAVSLSRPRSILDVQSAKDAYFGAPMIPEVWQPAPVSYTHLRAHATREDGVWGVGL